MAQVSALRAGLSVPVNGLLTTLAFRNTCIRDAADTICASLIPPGPKGKFDVLPSMHIGELVNGIVVRGAFPGHPTTLTWKFVSSSA